MIMRNLCRSERWADWGAAKLDLNQDYRCKSPRRSRKSLENRKISRIQVVHCALHHGRCSTSAGSTENDPLRERQIIGEVDRGGLPAHVRLPGIRTGLAPAA